jgi:hypothetical protein
MPVSLDLLARQRADSMGLSVNALVLVALYDYLEVRFPPPAEPAEGFPKTPTGKRVHGHTGKPSRLSKADRVRIHNERFELEKKKQLDLLAKQ